MTNTVLIDIESPEQVAMLNFLDGNYELIKKPEGQLCSGYGYFKNIQGDEKLAALVAINGNLYLYFDQLYELNSDDTDAKLKSGFFINNFILKKKEKPVLEIKYKPTSYDAGVFENIADFFSDKALSAIWISNTIEILSETDPDARREVDRRCVEKLCNAKKSSQSEN